MATCIELKNVARARLKTSKILMDAKDWEGAAYMLGYVLETALKAATCKALHLLTYPENTKNVKIDSYFMTHKFDQLLIASGLEDIFSLRGPSDAYRNWSEFTTEYPGDWPAMRYTVGSHNWDEQKVLQLYNNLTDPNMGIITVIKKRKRW